MVRLELMLTLKEGFWDIALLFYWHCVNTFNGVNFLIAINSLTS